MSTYMFAFLIVCWTYYIVSCCVQMTRLVVFRQLDTLGQIENRLRDKKAYQISYHSRFIKSHWHARYV